MSPALIDPLTSSADCGSVVPTPTVPSDARTKTPILSPSFVIAKPSPACGLHKNYRHTAFYRNTEPADPSRSHCSGHEESRALRHHNRGTRETQFPQTRNVAVAFTLASEEGFQMSGDDSIKRVVFRIGRPVPAVGNHSGIASCKLACNSL